MESCVFLSVNFNYSMANKGGSSFRVCVFSFTVSGWNRIRIIDVLYFRPLLDHIYTNCHYNHISVMFTHLPGIINHQLENKWKNSNGSNKFCKSFKNYTFGQLFIERWNRCFLLFCAECVELLNETNKRTHSSCEERERQGWNCVYRLKVIANVTILFQIR